MANNCADGVYNIHYTDTNKNPITINKKTLVQDVLDIILLGKARKEYGEVFDENILHILENFASPENVDNPGNPDFNQTYSNLLEHPTTGQLWYNTTQNKIFIYDGQTWIAMGESSDVAGNSGIIAHGQQLPKPISVLTGYEFDYSECSWIVSPFNYPAQIDWSVCYTDTNALVNAQYRLADSQTLSEGYAFYQIIGIKSNTNQGVEIPVTQIIPSPTPLPNVSITPSATIGSSPTPSPAASTTASPTPTATPTFTPVPSVSATPTRTPPASPTPTNSPTPSIQPLKALLYITPSLGYPNGTNTSLPSSCTTSSTSDVGCYFNLGIIIQNLSGGTPPYSIDFSNVAYKYSITNTSGGTNPVPKITYTYSGASGASTSSIRTGATSTSVLEMNGQISEQSNYLYCANGNWTLGLLGGSYVTITDSTGKELKLYTPSGLNGNVYGTAYTTPQGDYTDSWFSTSNCTQSTTLTTTNTCVATTSYLNNGILAGNVEIGQEMLTSDPYNFFDTMPSKVSYSKTSSQPCVRIVTESGASLICSTTAPIPTLDNGYMLAPAIMGRKVPVMRSNISSWEKIVLIEFVGYKDVQHITVDDKCFWAGEVDGVYILHHNKTNVSATNTSQI